MSPFITSATAGVLAGCSAETPGMKTLATLKKRLDFDYRASTHDKIGRNATFQKIPENVGSLS